MPETGAGLNPEMRGVPCVHPPYTPCAPPVQTDRRLGRGVLPRERGEARLRGGDRGSGIDDARGGDAASLRSALSRPSPDDLNRLRRRQPNRLRVGAVRGDGRASGTAQAPRTRWRATPPPSAIDDARGGDPTADPSALSRPSLGDLNRPRRHQPNRLRVGARRRWRGGFAFIPRGVGIEGRYSGRFAHHEGLEGCGHNCPPYAS